MNWTIDWQPTLKSTQTSLKEAYLNRTASLNTVLATLNQTQGYGRHQRAWQAPPGNLSVSLLFEIPSSLVVPQINFVAALSLMDLLNQLFKDFDIKLKWPNDIYINSKKCAGFLSQWIETTPHEMAIVLLGMGINLNSSAADFESPLIAQIATLKDLTGQTTDPVVFLNEFLNHFSNNLNLFKENGLNPWLPFLNTHLLFKNESVCLKEHEQIVATGLLKGITLNGELILESSSHLLTHHLAGDLSLIKEFE